EGPQRPVQVADQEVQQEQVEEDGEGPPQAVVALALGPLDVGDGDLGDAAALEVAEDRHEAVEVAEQAEVAGDVGAGGGEGGAEVVQRQAGDAAQEVVGDAAR